MQTQLITLTKLLHLQNYKQQAAIINK